MFHNSGAGTYCIADEDDGVNKCINIYIYIYIYVNYGPNEVCLAMSHGDGPFSLSGSPRRLHNALHVCVAKKLRMPV